MEYAVNAQDLFDIADAIRSKNGTQEPISFPDGFVDSINNSTAPQTLYYGLPRTYDGTEVGESSGYFVPYFSYGDAVAGIYISDGDMYHALSSDPYNVSAGPISEAKPGDILCVDLSNFSDFPGAYLAPEGITTPPFLIICEDYCIHPWIVSDNITYPRREGEIHIELTRYYFQLTEAPFNGGTPEDCINNTWPLNAIEITDSNTISHLNNLYGAITANLPS